MTDIVKPFDLQTLGPTAILMYAEDRREQCLQLAGLCDKYRAEIEALKTNVTALETEIAVADVRIGRLIDDINNYSLTGKWKGELPLNGNQEHAEETASGG